MAASASASNMEYVLEVCVDNIESAINAENGGADRIELCSALELGGITPSAGLVKIVKQNLTIPVFMLIRPRAGDFEYSELELKQMEEDIRTGIKYEVDGFVTGAIKNGKVDKNACHRLIDAACGLPVTFHRAYDTITDSRALYDIIVVGFSRILTSGRAPTAMEGKDHIKTLVERAGKNIIIMPGSGISQKNILELARHTKAQEFHSSAQLPRPVIIEEPETPVVQGTTFYPMAHCGVVKNMKRILDTDV